MKKLFLVTLISLIMLSGCESKQKENTSKIVKNNGMLSYTIDGSPASEKPTKESGYLVNSIKCDNGSILVWDNDNWQVELTEPKGSDRCIVDFTKNTSNPGYRVTATSNIENVLDSYSKATTNGGTVEIYTKNEIEIKSISGCTGTVENNKAVISNVTQNQTCNIEIEPSLANYVKLAYKPKSGRTNFSEIDDGKPALYKGTDDYGTTYYFSGDGSSMNNWVSFAGSMWRIIRINGNGSVRLLYAGSGGEDGYVTTSTYSIDSSTYNHPAYVGWKYTVGETQATDRENATASGAYKAVNSWYTGLSVENKNYIETEAIYCNDRSIGSGSYSTSSTFYYGAYSRLQSKGIPTLQCSDAADKFNTFGLMTADEVVYAGGLWGTNNASAYYYLNASNGSSTGSNYWWTMSPSYFSVNGTRIFAFVVVVHGSSNPGILGSNSANGSSVIRPVISLKKEVQVTSGDGSANTPYEVILP